MVDYLALIWCCLYIIFGCFLPLILHHLLEQFSLTSDKLISLCWPSIIFLNFPSFLRIMTHKYLYSFFQICPLNLLYLAYQFFVQYPSKSFLVNKIHWFHVDQLQDQNAKRIVIRKMFIICVDQIILIKNLLRRGIDVSCFIHFVDWSLLVWV